MKKYHLANNIIGWVVCAIACTVYVLTAEATASWWDCGEYIATAYKLQVGHPPGAPTFQLIGRLFSMFSDPESVSHAVNVMSALCSGFTILFLFWGITLLGKHLLPDPKNPSLKDFRTWAVFAAGVVGALAYTFTDTFWFSAVEGEVYAMSSLFTAIVFWAILKWEEQSDDPHSLRWLILICLLVGVAIGVHLLNLLTVPAIVYVVYFKKWPKTTWKGFILSGVVSVALLAIILWGIIPGIVNVDSAFDVFFVNTLGLPFNSGTIFFFALLVAAIIWSLIYTHKKGKPIINAAILGFTMLVIGYSTFFVLVIRANTNTPLNENAPKDAVALRAYLGREQYGDTPLLTGQFYTAGRPIDVKDGYTKYVKGKDAAGKDRYVPVAHAQKYVYRQNHTGVFPRMWSDDAKRGHPKFYEYWAGKVRGDRKPTGAQNIKFFNRYQLNWMYWRYFMWNFAGRQNDIQGHHFNEDGTIDYINGNWISGIKFIDEARLGPQDNLPDHLANNKARNRYYMLPLLLGLIGLVYHVVKHPKDAFIVFLMFFMTGLAIAIYLNMPPKQPRERDYAFVGSFSFFAIWIGLSVMALSEWITKLLKNEKLYKVVMPVVFLLCMGGAPVILAAENWDDHDRSQKYAARDFAKNYIGSVSNNGILITFGDNDTFPLWNVQEVEGFRTDVRILNYTLSGMYWYVEQLFNKLYDSEPLPFTLPKEYYGLGRDVVYIMDRSNDYLEVTDVLGMLRDHPEKFTVDQRGSKLMYIPTKRFKITLDVDALVKAGVITAEQAETINPEIRWEINQGTLYRHELMILDILGTNKFMREISIMNPGYIRSIYPLVDRYSVQEAMNFKLVPYPRTATSSRYTANTADYFINGFDGKPLQWGNLNSDIYVDPVSENMSTAQRQTYLVLAFDLFNAGDTARARQLIDDCEEAFPVKNFPRNVYSFYIYAGNQNYIDVIKLMKDIYGVDRAREVWNQAYEYYLQDLTYFAQFKGSKASGVRNDLQTSIQLLSLLSDIARLSLGDNNLANEAKAAISGFGPMYTD
ncbi:MAG: DUF2723 domain-containing protein [Bacteroidales bacterium]|nr:DUF2723 domain-containing protein [Bacteroidales bacterium]